MIPESRTRSGDMDRVSRIIVPSPQGARPFSLEVARKQLQLDASRNIYGFLVEVTPHRKRLARHIVSIADMLDYAGEERSRVRFDILFTTDSAADIFKIKWFHIPENNVSPLREMLFT